MRSKVGLVALSLLLLALAGCTAEGGDDAPDNGSQTTRSTTTTSASPAPPSATPPATPSGPTPSANAAPQVSLTAGQVQDAPRTVRFTAWGQDPDGDALNWVLEFGDGNRQTGTSLPVTTEHIYPQSGSFSALLTVNDGKAPGAARLVVSVTAPPASSNQGTSPPSNTVPSIDLTANRVSGTAPLAVRFFMDGSDPEGAALTWTLEFGDGQKTTGSRLPANTTHTFVEPGQYVARLTLTDGELIVSRTLAIQVAGAIGGASGPVVLEGEVLTNCGTVEGCYTIGAEGCVSWLLREQGIDCVWFELPADLVGKPFTTASPGDIDADFRSDCTLAGSSVAIFGNAGQESGVVPAAGCVVLSDYVGGGLLRITIG